MLTRTLLVLSLMIFGVTPVAAADTPSSVEVWKSATCKCIPDSAVMAPLVIQFIGQQDRITAIDKSRTARLQFQSIYHKL